MVLCGFAVLLNAYYLSKLGWLQFMYSRYEMQDRAIALFPTESVGVVLRACTSMALLVAFVALLRFRKEAKLAIQLGEHVSARTHALQHGSSDRHGNSVGRQPQSHFQCALSVRNRNAGGRHRLRIVRHGKEIPPHFVWISRCAARHLSA